MAAFLASRAAVTLYAASEREYSSLLPMKMSMNARAMNRGLASCVVSTWSCEQENSGGTVPGPCGACESGSKWSLWSLFLPELLH